MRGPVSRENADGRTRHLEAERYEPPDARVREISLRGFFDRNFQYALLSLFYFLLLCGWSNKYFNIHTFKLF